MGDDFMGVDFVGGHPTEQIVGNVTEQQLVLSPIT